MTLQQFCCVLGPDSPPTNVTLSVLSSTSILVSWNEVNPIDQNGIVTVYEVFYQPLVDFNGQISSSFLNTSMMALTLTGLEMFVTYNISVSAYTIRGAGPNSPQQSATTLEDSKLRIKLSSVIDFLILYLVPSNFPKFCNRNLHSNCLFC